MDVVLIGALVVTYSVLVTVFIVAFRHADKIDKQRHLNR
ncbi:MAG: hypothetical protein K0R98_1933 [Rickettsiaceae bacterium]|jgi:hypothetical protein|nr:hypothetical protein [Rickettsiaceae bacterium]